ncbi:hypothetical protein BFJ66_g15919 [Fusarium oxysporum f. sp. cepae]|uniref:Uncharacterized protein n=1 Tax=Fusarium oxysporum f. sp. cepae TaxID=396571 RepID=A0A3L6N0G5_FUSOX|nr:hypothetical protein BFJ65_g14838 [Fusarium oxysporum f. sp. cepae]RKK26992.1 hypothetical protein BFJ67_g16359 [Fusarium oxysporum f. sp. cepae]RKK31291.1 hypothetical protein BFJ66_g15919 [Fusarium oxysporum f. sp. cepae]
MPTQNGGKGKTPPTPGPAPQPSPINGGDTSQDGDVDKILGPGDKGAGFK